MNQKNKKPGFFKSYGWFWKNYVNFTSSSSRPEYWWTFLMNILIHIIILLVLLLFIIFGISFKQIGIIMLGLIFIIIILLYSLAIIIPTVSLTIRRYRDVGISPWWLLLTYLVPAILALIDESFLNYDNVPLTVLAFVFFIANWIICMLPTKKQNN